MKLRLFAIVLLLISSHLQAYDFGEGKINIPAGFEGPFSQDMGREAKSIAFKYPHNENFGTLLQVTIWDPGQEFPALSDNELKTGSEQYLLQFLGGIERKRESFKKGRVEFVTISGRPAAKVTWSGSAAQGSLHGVMYCLIHNSKIISFHTQDFTSFDGKFTKLAVAAFESVELKR